METKAIDAAAATCEHPAQFQFRKHDALATAQSAVEKQPELESQVAKLVETLGLEIDCACNAPLDGPHSTPWEIERAHERFENGVAELLGDPTPNPTKSASELPAPPISVLPPPPQMPPGKPGPRQLSSETLDEFEKVVDLNVVGNSWEGFVSCTATLDDGSTVDWREGHYADYLAYQRGDFQEAA